MKKILLDTNFLIDLFRFKIGMEEIGNLLTEPYEFFIPTSVIKELKKISMSKGNDSKYAKLALRLAEGNRMKTIESIKMADKAIVDLADKDTLVATNDMELRKTLKRLRIKTIYLRGRKYLGIG